jgi:recombination protein RecR
MDYPSKVLSKAVEEISGLPGIGKKSALRLALHLLRQPASQGISLGSSIQNLVTDIKYCKECHNPKFVISAMIINAMTSCSAS